MSLTITAGAVAGAAAAYGNSGTTGTTVRAPQPAATSEAPVVAPDVAPAVQTAAVEAARTQDTSKAQDTAKRPGTTASKHRDAVTITYDSLAGVNVFKAFDTKGNLVVQVPPAQLLKTMELEGKSAEEIKGQLINTKI